jgi:predicted lipoprotein with Yx(FWY)xxD motif
MRRGRRTGPGRRPGARSAAGPALAWSAAVLLAAGCASAPAGGRPASGTRAPGSRAVTVMARRLPDDGTVLVTSKSYALYMFAPDKRRAMTCTGACAATWPPLRLPPGSRLVAGTGVKRALLGSDPDPSGGRVVTYNGWPLYTYTRDFQPGLATGQDLNLNGGEWYVIRPSGQPLIPAS